MNFIHIADVHLGAEPDSGKSWSKERKNAIWQSFKNIIAETERQKADLLLIAGDLFHCPPLLRDLKEVDYLFSTLTAAKVVIIAGNHDYIRRGSCYEDFSWGANVTFLKQNTLNSVYFEEINTTVWGLSYHSREIKEPLYDNLYAPEDGRIHILLAHGGDEKHIPIDKKRLLLSGFDYAALGHIHKPEAAQNGQYAYSGSLEPTDRNDVGKRGYIYGEIDKGQRRLKWIPASSAEYIPLTIAITPHMTVGEAQTAISQAMAGSGGHNIFKITLNGFRDPHLNFDPESLKTLGRIVSITDNTEPEYDLEELYLLHKNDLIGYFIDTFAHDPIPDKKALYYGMKALMGTLTDDARTL